jgi:hypothetical protein
MVAAEAAKDALEALAATDTEPGTEIAGLELESATEADAAVGLVSVTVHVVDPGAENGAGVHVRLAGCANPTTLTVEDRVWLFRVAVIVDV